MVHGLLVMLLFTVSACEETDAPQPIQPVEEVQPQVFFQALMPEVRNIWVPAQPASEPRLEQLNATLHVPEQAFIYADDSSQARTPNVRIRMSILRHPLDFIMDSSFHVFGPDRFTSPMLRVRFHVEDAEGKKMVVAPRKNLVFDYTPEISQPGQVSTLMFQDSNDLSVYPPAGHTFRMSNANGVPSVQILLPYLDSAGIEQIHSVTRQPMSADLTLANAPQQGKHYVWVVYQNQNTSYWGEHKVNNQFHLSHIYHDVPVRVVGLSFNKDKVFVGHLDTVLRQDAQEPIRLSVYPDTPEAAQSELRQLLE